MGRERRGEKMGGETYGKRGRWDKGRRKLEERKKGREESGDNKRQREGLKNKDGNKHMDVK